MLLAKATQSVKMAIYLHPTNYHFQGITRYNFAMVLR